VNEMKEKEKESPSVEEDLARDTLVSNELSNPKYTLIIGAIPGQRYVKCLFLKKLNVV
jgi:hypothetical protein